MKYILLIMAFPFLSATKCGSHAADEEKSKGEITHAAADSMPACLRQMIEGGKNQEPSNPPVQADEYLYNGKKVYLFRFGCCDQFNMLYDDSCRNICAPSGGFSGRGDGKCPDFSKTATFIRSILKDSTR